MSNRRGMTLILVLVMSAFIGMSAMLLFSTTNMETMIAGNIRRMNQAKISAASGINHFIALQLNYNTLRRRAGELQTVQVIPRTDLSNRTSYEVKVYFSPVLSAGQYVVESTGYYTKGDKVLSSHPIKALFQGEQ
jgi:type II secretory pathway component PulK